ncbi:kinase-like protein [Atractiella rhizophila]|nr:kinase-like protein [Atractiella rhizophila]
MNLFRNLFRSRRKFLDPNHYYFRHTSNRFLTNEEKELADRYLYFNVEELEKEILVATGATRVLSMEKLPEGTFNKVFLVKTDGPHEVIARLPNPNTRCPDLVTATEVANMKFVASLGIKVPRVLHWSSPDHHNQVGSPFIIMSKAPGVAMNSVELSWSQRVKILEQVVEMERKLVDVDWKKFGSLHCDANGRLAVGPSTNLCFWDDEKSTMNIDRGPWNDAHSYFRALVESERLLVERFGKDVTRFTWSGYVEETVAEYLDLFDDLLTLLPSLIPKDPDLTRSVLLHRDLHGDNIFIDESTADITCIIDWQMEHPSPLLSRPLPPRVFLHSRPSLQCLMPQWQYPDNYDELDNEAKAAVDAAKEKAELQNIYLGLTKERNPTLFKGQSFLQRDLVDFPLLQIRRTTTDGIVPLRESLLRVVDNWTLFNSETECPVPPMGEAEREQHRYEAAAWQNMRDHADQLASFFGAGRDGCIDPERFEKVQNLNKRGYEAWMQRPPRAEELSEERKETHRSLRSKAWPFPPE